MQDDDTQARTQHHRHDAQTVHAPADATAIPNASTSEEFVHGSAMALTTRFTTIHGYASLLERVVNRTPYDHERITRYSHLLKQQTDDLGHLLEHYLQAAALRWGTRTLARRVTSLDELTATIRDRWSVMPAQTTQHTLVIERGEPVTGRWDPFWLTSAVSALVSNAFKYTPDGGTITIRVQREGESAVVSVTDPGLGIDEDEREAIFQPFVRGRAAQGDIPGWGLGLYIAAQAVTAHGGEIKVDSMRHAGTTMTIRLPIDAPPSRNA